MAVSSQAVELFACLSRELWVVTAAAGEMRGGLTATWVSQASIDAERPVVAAAIAVNHHTRSVIDAAGAFAVHLLRSDQGEAAYHFARSTGHEVDKLAGISYQTGTTGSPILEDCLGWIEGRVYDCYDGGDRIYYWADVVAASGPPEGSPLTDQQWISAAGDQVRAELAMLRRQDAEQQRPLLDAWRSGLS